MQLRALRYLGFTAATCGLLISPARAVTTTETSPEPHGHWWKSASRVQPAASTKGDLLIAKPSVRYSAGSGTLTIFAPADTEIFCEQDAQGFVLDRVLDESGMLAPMVPYWDDFKLKTIQFYLEKFTGFIGITLKLL